MLATSFYLILVMWISHGHDDGKTKIVREPLRGNLTWEQCIAMRDALSIATIRMGTLEIRSTVACIDHPIGGK